MTPYIIDRSGADLDDRCRQAFWWNRLEGGIGIVHREEALALRIGREIHEDFAALAALPDLSDSVLDSWAADMLAGSEDLSQEEREYRYRRVGWFVSWALYIEPLIRERFDTIHIEHELILDRGRLWVPVQPDRVLRSKASPHQIVYLEYKSTREAGKKWMESWKYAIQLHLGMAAIAEELKESVQYAQIVALQKGSNSASDGRLLHPYVWGYYNRSTDGWTGEYEKARSNAWEPMPVWEYPAGIVAWVRFCGEDIARSQFPRSAPVFLDSRMLEIWIGQRTAREWTIRQHAEDARVSLAARSVWFPRTLAQCRPAYGEPCPYLKACWVATTEADPLADPDYIPRTPHHEVERILKGA